MVGRGDAFSAALPENSRALVCYDEELSVEYRPYLPSHAPSVALRCERGGERGIKLEAIEPSAEDRVARKRRRSWRGRCRLGGPYAAAAAQGWCCGEWDVAPLTTRPAGHFHVWRNHVCVARFPFLAADANVASRARVGGQRKPDERPGHSRRGTSNAKETPLDAGA